MKSDSQKLEEIREVVQRKGVLACGTEALHLEEIREILGESPSNQECDLKHCEVGCVNCCKCPDYCEHGYCRLRCPNEECQDRPKKCSCREDFCDPECPIHEGNWINEGQVSPAAPRPKKNNTKECDCWSKCGAKKGESLECPIHDCPPGGIVELEPGETVESKCKCPKKEERCTCRGILKPYDCPVHGKCLCKGVDFSRCPKHKPTGEPKLPSEIVWEICRYIDKDRGDRGRLPQEWINAILDYLDTKPWEQS